MIMPGIESRMLGRGALLLLAALLTGASASAAELFGQGEIPTPYLPSTQVAVEEMLRLADVRSHDVVVDLGSGDGRIPIAAAVAFGARGFGVDIDPKLVEEANANARKAGVDARVRFYQRDVFETDIREATVVTLYLLTGLVNRLKPKLMKELRPGARIVAHDFPFKDWEPDRRVNISKTYYLYIVPAQAGGRWRLEANLPGATYNYEMEIRQDHQKITGGVRTAGGSGYLPLFEPRLEGDRIRFVLVDEGHAHHFEGRIRGHLMEGTLRSGIGRQQAERSWRAERALAPLE